MLSLEFSLNKYAYIVMCNQPNYVLSCLVGKKFVNKDYSIEFKYMITNNLISSIHQGWHCPSGYKDSIPNEGCAYMNDHNQTINFEADDYGREDYLILKVIDECRLEIVHDRKNKLEGMILTLSDDKLVNSFSS